MTAARLLAAVLGLAASAASSAHAQAPVPGNTGQASVYDPQPPADSAYVRFVNSLGVEVALRPAFLPARRLGTRPEERVTAYAVAEKVAGRDLVVEATAQGGTARIVLRAAAGSFNTVVIHRTADGGLAGTAVTDQADFNRARSRLSFYNLASGCEAAALRLAPAGPVVFEHVAFGTAKSRSVNPVTAELKAGCGEDAAAPTFPLEGTEAGGMYSIWIIRPDGPALTAFVTRDTTAPWRR